MALRQTLFGAFVLQSSPMWPRNGCWLGLQLQHPTVEASRQKQVRMFIRIYAIFPICYTAFLTYSLLFRKTTSLSQIGAMLLIVKQVMICIVKLKLSCTTDLVKFRHLVYAAMSLTLTLYPMIATIIDPISMQQIPLVIARRFMLLCLIIVFQLLCFGQVAVGSLFFAVPGQIAYLVKCCLFPTSLAEHVLHDVKNVVLFSLMVGVIPIPYWMLSQRLVAKRARTKAVANFSTTCIVQNTLIGPSSRVVADIVDLDVAQQITNDANGAEAHLGEEKYHDPNQSAAPAAVKDSIAAEVRSSLRLTGEPVLDEASDLQLESTTSDCRLDKLRVLLLSGACVLEISRNEASRMTVQDLKERVSHHYTCPQDYCRLLLGERLLEDVCKLSELMRSQAMLEITVIFESPERGPFALGQEASWGVWENDDVNEFRTVASI